MGVAGIRSGGMTALRRVRSAFGGTAVVLAYHRFGTEPLDPQRLATDPAVFDEHIRALADGYHTITARDLFAHLSEKRPIPERTVVVTIDDGYTDVLHVGKPILERHGVPATVFVSSGCLGDPYGLWWDEVERAVLHVGELPSRIDVPVAGGFVREVSERSRSLDAADAAAFAGWDFTLLTIHERQRLYLDLIAFLNPLNAADRSAALTLLREQTGVKPVTATDKRPLTAEEAVCLGSGGLIELGAHTVTHQVLSRRTVDEQRQEIADDKRALEKLLGYPVVSFAYPHGGADDYTRESARLAAEAGFLGACTTRLGGALPWGSVGLHTDRFEVPRTHASRMSAAELTHLIDKRLGL